MIMCFTSIGPRSELMLNAGDKRIVYLRGDRGWLSHGLVVTRPIPLLAGWRYPVGIYM